MSQICWENASRKKRKTLAASHTKVAEKFLFSASLELDRIIYDKDDFFSH
jgi:hypothetical protein